MFLNPIVWSVPMQDEGSNLVVCIFVLTYRVEPWASTALDRSLLKELLPAHIFPGKYNS